MKKKLVLVLIFLLIVGLGGIFASQKYKRSGKSRFVKIDMKSGNNFFEPDVIHAKSGDMLEFDITNDGYHTFVISTPKSYMSFKKELSETFVKFTYQTNEKGTFEFFCDVPGHKADGQKGVLIVE